MDSEKLKERFNDALYKLHKKASLLKLNKHTYARARLNFHPRIKNPDENILIVYEG